MSVKCGLILKIKYWSFHRFWDMNLVDAPHVIWKRNNEKLKINSNFELKVKQQIGYLFYSLPLLNVSFTKVGSYLYIFYLLRSKPPPKSKILDKNDKWFKKSQIVTVSMTIVLLFPNYNGEMEANTRSVHTHQNINIEESICLHSVDVNNLDDKPHVVGCKQVCSLVETSKKMKIATHF